MKVEIKHKGQDEVLFTIRSADVVSVVGEFLAVESTGNLKVGNYNLLDFDFEVFENDE